MTLSGSRELKAKTKKAIGELRYLEAERRAAEMVIDQARNNAPVRTGELRDSMHNVGGNMYIDVVYGNPIHWGWAKRNIKPNPFLLETARRLEPTWLRFFEEEIDDALELME